NRSVNYQAYQPLNATDLLRQPSCNRRSMLYHVRIALVASAASTQHAPTAHAHCAASSIVAPRINDASKPAYAASPAPVVPTTATSNAGCQIRLSAFTQSLIFNGDSAASR